MHFEKIVILFMYATIIIKMSRLPKCLSGNFLWHC